MSTQDAYINIHNIISLGHSECLAFPASTVNMGKDKMTGMGFGEPNHSQKNRILFGSSTSVSSV